MPLQMAKKRPTPEESALQHENRVLVEMLVERQLQLAEVLEDNVSLHGWNRMTKCNFSVAWLIIFIHIKSNLKTPILS